MVKKLVVFTLLFLFSLFLSINSSYSLTYIDSCYSLTTENETYVLNQSIGNYNGNCINVNANNITLDCNGYSIENITEGAAIYSYGYSNIVIENCIIRNVTSNSTFSRGIYIRFSNNIEINNVDVSYVNNIYNKTPNLASALELFNCNNVYVNNFNASSIDSLYYDTSIIRIIDTNNTFFNNVNFSGYFDNGNIFYVPPYSNNISISNVVSDDYKYDVDAVILYNSNNVSNSSFKYVRYGIGNVYNSSLYNVSMLCNYDCLALYDNNVVNNCVLNSLNGNSLSVLGSNNLIYNNLFNGSYYFSGSNYLNTTKQEGTRIYSNGNYIGGNYWTNLNGAGYSDTCTDADKDGFCDEPYVLYTNNVDYLPYSDEYVEHVCGDGICSGSENSSNCPQDCYCGDGRCYKEDGENSLNCDVDCAIRVDSCKTLSIENETYVLNQSIGNYNGNCINVNANNITLDCKGYYIENITNGYAISVSSQKNNIVIRNCNIRNINNTGISLHNNNNNSVIYNVSIKDIYGNSSFSGIYVYGFNNTIRNVVIDNLFRNVSGGNVVYGISLSSSNSYVENVTINNLFNGFYVYGFYVDGINNSFYNVNLSNFYSNGSSIYGFYVDSINNSFYNVNLSNFYSNGSSIYGFYIRKNNNTIENVSFKNFTTVSYSISLISSYYNVNMKNLYAEDFVGKSFYGVYSSFENSSVVGFNLKNISANFSSYVISIRNNCLAKDIVISDIIFNPTYTNYGIVVENNSIVDNVTIENITGKIYGIGIGNNSVVRNSKINGAYYGIYSSPVYTSYRYLIENVNVTANYGIYLYRFGNLTILNSDFSNSNYTFYDTYPYSKDSCNFLAENVTTASGLPILYYRNEGNVIDNKKFDYMFLCGDNSIVRNIDVSNISGLVILADNVSVYNVSLYECYNFNYFIGNNISLDNLYLSNIYNVEVSINGTFRNSVVRNTSVSIGVGNVKIENLDCINEKRYCLYVYYNNTVLVNNSKIIGNTSSLYVYQDELSNIKVYNSVIDRISNDSRYGAIYIPRYNKSKIELYNVTLKDYYVNQSRLDVYWLLKVNNPKGASVTIYDKNNNEVSSFTDNYKELWLMDYYVIPLNQKLELNNYTIISTKQNYEDLTINLILNENKNINIVLKLLEKKPSDYLDVTGKAILSLSIGLMGILGIINVMGLMYSVRKTEDLLLIMLICAIVTIMIVSIWYII